jgi:hypothetical protein
MPRKQRFKPTRKPKLTPEGAVERTQEQQQNRPPTEESVASHRTEEHDNERRSE